MDIDEAKKYISNCIDRVGVCFNPDENPKDYIIQSTGEPVLTEPEAAAMDNLLNKYVQVFDDENICIYEFCTTQFKLKNYI